jgi:AAA domain/Bifunctional DNA primase/polymerase, N-terminal
VTRRENRPGDTEAESLTSQVKDDTTALAQQLHDRGLHVFPVDHPYHPKCIGKHGPTSPCDGERGKHPAVKWGTWAVAPTPKMIALEWGKYGGIANIGVACGPSNLVVLDEDQDGELERWCVTYGITLPDTHTVSTGRGRHLYFRWDHTTKQITNSPKAVTGFTIDVRGHGGYAVAEGSQHKNGTIYTGNDHPIADLPDAVAKLLVTESNATTTTSDITEPVWEKVEPERIDYHHRHRTLVAYAGRLRKSGLDYDEVEQAFRERWLYCEQPEGQIPEARFHSTTCLYPVTWDEAKAKLAGIFHRYPRGTGGAPAESSEPNDSRPYKDKLITRSDLLTLPEPEPLIDNVLDLGTTALLYGKWGTAKTFIALDWAASVATGRTWFDRETVQRKVLYVVGEGAFGFKGRVDAWETGWGKTISDEWLAILPEPVNLTRDIDVANLYALIASDGYDFVIFDTLARCMVGADENSAKDSGRVVDAMTRLLGATPGRRGVILGVHHPGKDAKTLRGSSAFEGAADTVYFTNREENWISLTRQKRKDGPEHDHHLLELDPIPGTNSCVLKSSHGLSQGDETGDRAATLRLIMSQHFSLTGATSTQLQKVAVDEGPMTRPTYYRAVNDLLESGWLTNTGTDKRPFYFIKD